MYKFLLNILLSIKSYCEKRLAILEKQDQLTKIKNSLSLSDNNALFFENSVGTIIVLKKENFPNSVLDFLYEYEKTDFSDQEHTAVQPTIPTLYPNAQPNFIQSTNTGFKITSIDYTTVNSPKVNKSPFINPLTESKNKLEASQETLRQTIQSKKIILKDDPLFNTNNIPKS